MSVRAKFEVRQVQDRGWCTEVELWPVYDGSEENKQFFEATPNGTIRMTIKNDVAATQFHQGQEMYVDFTPAS